MDGPDFLGVGPEKTGTTWIYNTLSKFSQIWVPPLKELRYFWEEEAFPGEGPFKRFQFFRGWHRRQYAYYACIRVGYYLRHPLRVYSEWDRVIWDFRYLFSRHTDEWYLSAFNPGKDRISGEISPQYFFLPEPQLQRIRKIIPHAKIIVTLREPQDWVWSFARMGIRNGFLRSDEASLRAFIQGKIASSQYTPALRRWHTHFSKAQVLVLFYDELKSDPQNFLNKILNFLELDFQGTDLKAAHPRNVGLPLTMPDSLRALAIEGWQKDIEHLADIMPNVPAEWRR